MSDDDSESTPVGLARPEEEASRLKALAVEEYTSGNLEAAVKHAKRAHKLHPSLDGLPEMLGALKILRTAAAPISESASEGENPLIDYYEILGVGQFSHIDVIKKQYKKLAMSIHPDKNPSVASEEAFKLVGEAARMLSDRSRRKEYDTRLRVALQSIASKASGLAAEQTFSTACSSCRWLHQFERKYLGHNLMCPRCKKSFKAVESKEDRSNGENSEKNGSVGVVQTRISARLKEKVARGESIGIVERCGLGMKRKVSSVGEGATGSTPEVAISTDGDDYLLKDLVPKIVKKVVKSGEDDGGLGLKEAGGGEVGVENGSKRRVGVDEVTDSGGVEVVESERAEKGQSMEEGTMTLLQMKMLVKKKKKKLGEGRVAMSGKKVDFEKMKTKKRKRGREGNANEEREYEKEKDGKIENEKKREEENENMNKNEEIVERDEKDEKEDKEEGAESKNRREKENEKKATRKGKKKRRETLKEAERDTDNEKEKKEEEIGSKMMMEGDNEENGEVKEIEYKREKHVRRCVSRYRNLETLQSKTLNDHADRGIEPRAAKKQGNLEIMPVEDSDFYDFDKDRTERNFKTGQVWAAYDDSDGMPRHYALIDDIVSVHPFEVTLIWLHVRSNGQGESTSHVSCGNFKIANKVSTKYLNLFSHVVDYARTARQVYRIYPKKGSTWALYRDSASDAEGSRQIDKNKKSFDIVVCLSTYSNVHGLSIAHLEKVPGFKTVFKRSAIGANAVVCLGKDDATQFSHQIPSKILSSKEISDLPKDCWELDPASLPPEFLCES